MNRVKKFISGIKITILRFVDDVLFVEKEEGLEDILIWTRLKQRNLS